jgi:hypothetical protein
MSPLSGRAVRARVPTRAYTVLTAVKGRRRVEEVLGADWRARTKRVGSLSAAGCDSQPRTDTREEQACRVAGKETRKWFADKSLAFPP